MRSLAQQLAGHQPAPVPQPRPVCIHPTQVASSNCSQHRTFGLTTHHNSWHSTVATAAGDAAAATTSSAIAAGGLEEQGSTPSAANFDEDQYELTAQAEERRKWAADVRGVTAGAHPAYWSLPQHLDPPALLGNVAVVLVGPKKPASTGSVARSCSCFEVGQLRLVAPRCDPLSRSSKSVSKGAQYVLYQAGLHETVQDALQGVQFSVAFTRWLEGSPRAVQDLPSLLQLPQLRQILGAPGSGHSTLGAGAAVAGGRSETACTPATPTGKCQQVMEGTAEFGPGSSASLHHVPLQLALVFGREEFGLSDEEVAACDVACSIPIGRMQESLSVAHAVSIVLSQLFQYRRALL